MSNMDVSIKSPSDEAEDSYTDDSLFKISSWGADLSFRELIARYDDNELVKPELQRKYVWDRVEASRFIDSVLLGLPVPSIFLAKTIDEKLLIIDGYQRLMTVRDFVKGIFTEDGREFALSKSEKIHERWRGKTFENLSDEERRKIRNTTIHAIIFMQQHPSADDTSLYQIFERINTSGRSLLPQEIRNCVYQGPLNSLLIKLNKKSKWRELLNTPAEDSRMKDLELILRFFALSDDYILNNSEVPYNISLKKYLNEFMGKNNTAAKANSLEKKFDKTLDFVSKFFGSDAFHNVLPSDSSKYAPALSSTVFDAIMVGSWLLIKEKGDVKKTSDKYRLAKLNKLSDPAYQRILSHETMRSGNIKRRVREMCDSLKDA